MPTFRVVVNAVAASHASMLPTCGLRVDRVASAPCADAAARRVIGQAGWSDGMVGIWTARQRGLRGLGRRWTGRFGPGDDDGLSGVREPRRPRPSAGSASVSLDLPVA
jgi:hypothetical protein